MCELMMMGSSNTPLVRKESLDLFGGGGEEKPNNLGR